MSTESSATIEERLSASIRKSLAGNQQTPLHLWMHSQCHDSVALLRHASTFAPDEAFSIVVAAAAASLLDAAYEHRPLNVAYAVPLWRSITEGQVSVQYLSDNERGAGIFHDDAPSPMSTISHFDEYVAIGLARTRALDRPAREHLMQLALSSADTNHTALGWFAFDIETGEHRHVDELAQRFPSRWAQTYPDDLDAPIASLRAYLQAARKIGVIGALSPLELDNVGNLRVADAAWVVAWDEAARANAHGICADLALRRSKQLEEHPELYQRWLLIHGLHEEHKPERSVDSFPVSRELLDLMYHVDKPFVPASLCLSIAAKTNRLAPVLRETLPYLQGPTIPLLQAAFGVGEELESYAALADVNPAGALLALRMKLRAEHRAAQGTDTPRSRKTPPPAAILDNFETNEELANGPFEFEEELTMPRSDSPSDRLAGESKFSSLTDLTPQLHSTEKKPSGRDEAAQLNRWSEEWDDELQTNAILPKDFSPRSRTGPHTPSESLRGYRSGDEVSISTTSEPTELDIHLAASLPDELRSRADILLARRIEEKRHYSPEFLAALGDQLHLLPESSWFVSQELIRQEQFSSALAWMESIARVTTNRLVRAERYKALARSWADQLQEPAQALEYLIVSFTCAPTDAETLQMLDNIYSSMHRYADLKIAYRTALDVAAHDQTDEALRALWQKRLDELRAGPTGE